MPCTNSFCSDSRIRSRWRRYSPAPIVEMSVLRSSSVMQAPLMRRLESGRSSSAASDVKQAPCAFRHISTYCPHDSSAELLIALSKSHALQLQQNCLDQSDQIWQSQDIPESPWAHTLHLFCFASYGSQHECCFRESRCFREDPQDLVC